MAQTSDTRRVVIVGGGFAGLFAARELGNAPVQVTLLDRAEHHLFQPLLYQQLKLPSPFGQPRRTEEPLGLSTHLCLSSADANPDRRRVPRNNRQSRGSPGTDDAFDSERRQHRVLGVAG